MQTIKAGVFASPPVIAHDKQERAIDGAPEFDSRDGEANGLCKAHGEGSFSVVPGKRSLRGDSRRTLAAHDPILFYEVSLENCVEAYASGHFDNPDASPVLADYAAGFPSSLIQCSTREILLSDSVRFYRKLCE